jgi:tetratricopeptide (TPR) repeat protein
VGELVNRFDPHAVAIVLLASLSAARPLVGQLPEAEDAFTNGEYRLARQLYDSVLARDSLDPRALYRLAILDSWDGRLRQSLVRFVILRRVEPSDLDIMVAHARVLSWDGRQRYARALYDSVLAVAPDRVDALAGRARTVAWGGDLLQAERLWREALRSHPDEPELLIGLGQTLYWEGASTLAEGYVARAVELAPQDPTAQELFLLIRAEYRPEFSVSTDGWNDSDHNSAFVVTGTFAASPRNDLRGTLRGTWRRNRDVALRSSFSEGLDGWLVKRLGGATAIRAGAGLRRLDPDSGPTHTLPTAQVAIALRPAPFAAVRVGYKHYAFDETTELVRRGYAWNELDASVELSPRPALELSAAGDAAWLSDGNQRLAATATAMVGVWRGLHLGGYGRVMGYREEHPGRGYFSPDRYLLGEGRATYNWRRQSWSARAAAGLGVQQVGRRGTAQVEYHGDFTVARSWRTVDELALVALFTNSEAARTGAEPRATYRYWSVEMRYRLGL